MKRKRLLVPPKAISRDIERDDDRPADVVGKPPAARADAILHVIQTRWRIVAIVAAVGAIVGGALAGMHPHSYRTSAIAAVTAATAGLPPGEIYRGVEVLEQRTIVATVAALPSIPTIHDGATQTERGLYTIGAVVLPNTNLFRIEVDGPDARGVIRVANRVPPLLNRQTEALYKLYGVAMVSPASTTVSVGPPIGRGAAAGLILGIIIGAGLAFSIEAARNRHAIPVEAPPAIDSRFQ